MEPYIIAVGERDINLSYVTDVLYIEKDRDTLKPVALVSLAVPATGDSGYRLVKIHDKNIPALKRGLEDFRGRH